MLLLAAGMFFACNQAREQNGEAISQPEETLTGQWVRTGQRGPVSFEFKDNGLVEADFGNDQTIDAVASYELSGDTIRFIDQEGQMCQDAGLYKVYQTDYYVSFDLIDDDCGGRIQTTMGFWTRPDFKDFLKTLDDEIANNPEPELYLNRARIYLSVPEIS